MKEMALTNIKRAITADPLRSVAEVHEDVVNSVVESLRDRADREDFMRWWVINDLP